MAKKTTCPISRAEFDSKAEPLDVIINNQPHQAPVKKFSTGSLGWYLSGKMTVQLAGKPVAVQIGLNLTIVGSKDLPSEEVTSAPSPAVTPAAAPAPSPAAPQPGPGASPGTP